jgi:YD repeat-containing protein
MTTKVDAAGRPTIATYDDYGNVKSVVDQNGVGHFFEFHYDESKSEHYVRITSSAGRIKEVWYDRDGETKRVDINGRTIQKIDKDGRDLIITDEKGKVTLSLSETLSVATVKRPTDRSGARNGENESFA